MTQRVRRAERLRRQRDREIERDPLGVLDRLLTEAGAVVRYVPVIATACGRIGDPEPMRAALAAVGYREVKDG